MRSHIFLHGSIPSSSLPAFGHSDFYLFLEHTRHTSASGGSFLCPGGFLHLECSSPRCILTPSRLCSDVTFSQYSTLVTLFKVASPTYTGMPIIPLPCSPPHPPEYIHFCLLSSCFLFLVCLAALECQSHRSAILVSFPSLMYPKNLE